MLSEDGDFSILRGTSLLLCRVKQALCHILYLLIETIIFLKEDAKDILHYVKEAKKLHMLRYPFKVEVNFIKPRQLDDLIL